jgi:hypothetical protein
MRKLVLEPGEGAVPHRVYDLSIVDLQERKEQSIVFSSATEAMNYMGIGHTVFYRNRKSGCQIFSKKLNRKFAVRVADTSSLKA